MDVFDVFETSHRPRSTYTSGPRAFRSGSDPPTD